MTRCNATLTERVQLTLLEADKYCDREQRWEQQRIANRVAVTKSGTHYGAKHVGTKRNETKHCSHRTVNTNLTVYQPAQQMNQLEAIDMSIARMRQTIASDGLAEQTDELILLCLACKQD